MSEERNVVYCSGALFCPEEVAEMAEITKHLEDSGYRTFLPHRDGVEAFVMNMANNPFVNSIIFRPIQTLIHKAIFALDVYQIVIRCDSFVINLNGRVPDEGAVVETALAFTYGKPIIVYKNDPRQSVDGFEIPLLANIQMAKRVMNISDIPEAIELSGGANQALINANKLPKRIQKTVRFGRFIWKLVNIFRFLKPKNKFVVAD